LATLVIVGIPRAALACPVCFGQSDSPLANATNMGILAMLGVVGGVLAGFAAFIVHLNRRAKLVADEVDPTGVGQSQLSSSTPQEGIAQC
jgi:hypothetical protein